MRTYLATLNGVVIATAATESNCYFRAFYYCKKNGLNIKDVEIDCTE